MLQMSLLIYADGAILQFEWLEEGKAELSWTNSVDRHFVNLKDTNTGYEWRTGVLSGATTSFIIDDEVADDLSKYYKAPGNFQGWSEYAGDNFEMPMQWKRMGGGSRWTYGARFAEEEILPPKVIWSSK